MKSKIRFVVLFAVMCGFSSAAISQSINIDLDVGSGDPEQGNGAPSSSFGAAAGQPGYWNRVGFGANPVPLLGLDGEPTTIVMSVHSSGGFFGTGFRNESNTGDFALLLNDAVQIAALGPGGSKTYTFEGLNNGLFLVYTYAVGPSGYSLDTPILIEEAITNHTQIVSGPMPGNAFKYLVTHSVHEILADKGRFSVFVEQPPTLPNPMVINGFQIVSVPEPTSFCAIAIAGLLTIIRQRRALRLDSLQLKQQKIKRG